MVVAMAVVVLVVVVFFCNNPSATFDVYTTCELHTMAIIRRYQCCRRDERKSAGI